MAIELDLDKDEAQRMYCQGLFTQRKFQKAAKKGRAEELAYLGGWALQLLDRIAQAAQRADAEIWLDEEGNPLTGNEGGSKP